MDVLRNTKAPNLLLAPEEYDSRAQEQLTNQLRLYFSQIDSLNAQVAQNLRSLNVMAWLGGGGGC